MIDRFISLIGRTVCWLMPVMAAVTFLVVVMRYGFNTGSIQLQESVVYMQGALFMLSAAYCQQMNKHVRIDVFYARRSAYGRALIDFLGAVFFLLPVSLTIFCISWEYVFNSWSHLETSRNPSGLPFVYLLKTLLLVTPALLFLRGIVEIKEQYTFLKTHKKVKN